MREVIIVGSGPAGMGAALYARRAGLDTLILDGTGMPGGQITNTYEVDNYLGLGGANGFDLAMNFQSHVKKFGADWETARIDSIEKKEEGFCLRAGEKTFEGKTVIIATGASHRKLGVPGEEELSGMGVSYCATCDGAFYRNKVTAVIGGGDVAIEDAIFLSRFCEKVYLIHRRDELRGAKILQEQLFALENAEIIWDTVVDQIEGKEVVEGLSLTNKKTGEKSTLPVNGVFVAVGITPNTGCFTSLVETDEAGYIKAGEMGETSVPGIFAAGDIRTKELRQVITAVADGANAITSVQKYLRNL